MKPTPGKQYTTKENDTLATIASSAYGDQNQYVLISNVNQSQTKLTETSVIPAGTVLIIPVDTELDSIRKAQLRRGLA